MDEGGANGKQCDFSDCVHRLDATHGDKVSLLSFSYINSTCLQCIYFKRFDMYVKREK
jgi:hypothetical protein